MTAQRPTASAEPARNEAAERLRSVAYGTDLIGEANYQRDIDTALAAERRATVERIRAAVDAGPIARDEDDPEDEGDVSYGRVSRILDAVLDAGPYWGNNGGTGRAILDEELTRPEGKAER